MINKYHEYLNNMGDKYYDSLNENNINLKKRSYYKEDIDKTISDFNETIDKARDSEDNKALTEVKEKINDEIKASKEYLDTNKKDIAKDENERINKFIERMEVLIEKIEDIRSKHL